MKHIKMEKGFTAKLSGMPDTSVIHIREPETIGVSTMDIPYIRPKLLVKENDPVKTGTPLFCDKRNRCIHYVSPGTGVVRQIIFGERRRLKEVVIALGKEDEFLLYDTLSPQTLDTVPHADIAALLQKGGLWQCFREFPSKDTADENRKPPMIIVSLNGNDPFSPHPEVLLKNETPAFEFGIRLLKRFSDRVIVTSRENSLKNLNGIKEYITHCVPDIYPSWDPGTVLYHLKNSPEENRSWCISAEHLVLVARFLLTGKYPVKRMLTVTRSIDRKPHSITRQGTPIKNLIGKFDPDTVITSGRFNGRAVDPSSHLGFFENTLNVIPKGPSEEFFGFMKPGFSAHTQSKTFLSCLTASPKELDCNIHGEERACINCSYCNRICPVDLAPNFIMKSLLSDEIEDALSYGLLDCVRCGLCSYTCPSKIELVKILSNGMDAYYKDKE